MNQIELDLYRTLPTHKLMVNGYVLPSYVCRIIIHVLCLGRNIILCTVVLVTTDLPVYIHSIYMTLVCRTIPKHECFTDIISDQQTSQSASGLQLV